MVRMVTKAQVRAHALKARMIGGDDTGATMVEYGLIVAAIAAVVGVAAFALGGEIVDLFEGLLPIVP